MIQRTGRLSTPRAQRVRRSRAARVIVGAALVFLGTALFRLQVLAGEENMARAEGYRLRELPVPAPRGTIYDRTGRVVAENVPGFQILIMPSDSMNAQIERIQPIIGLTDAQLAQAQRRWQRAPHLPMALMEDAPPHAVAALAERRHQFPSVLVHDYAKRRYPAGAAIGHFIGYVNEINSEQLELPEFTGYEQGRWIGQTGLERQYEKLLGGTPGKRFLEIDARGRIRRWLPEETAQAPVPGRDLNLYLDLDLQEYIHEIFPREFDGAIVAIDPQTGGVLAYYSYPTFDPNQFIGGISQDDYNVLYEDPRIPLLDRVVGSRQPAASTWKLAVAGMALDLGLLDPEEYMPQSCTGSIFYGRTWRCHGVHGRQNLIEGIKNSCNVYFYQVGMRIGLDRMLEHGIRLGFEERTGIDVPHEIANQFPADRGYWERVYGYRANDNEVNSLSIGQGPMTMTIIKLAHMYAALTAANGQVPAPRLARESGVPADTFSFSTTPRDRWFLEAGMRRVVAPGGTAGRSRLPEWDFIGKTGTAQAPPGLDHGWFVGTGAREPGAPPEIAVTMFLARSEHGYTASGYVAEVINFYLSRKYGQPFQKWSTERFRSERGLQVDWQRFQGPVVDPPMPAVTAEDQRDPNADAAVDPANIPQPGSGGNNN